MKDLKGNPVQFINGSFSGDHLEVEIINSISADFDKDRLNDIAIIANIDSGGSGNFRHLFLLGNDGQNLIEKDNILLGDRIKVTDLKSENSQISVNYLDRAKTDSFAVKPHIKEEKHFKVQDMKLVPLL